MPHRRSVMSTEISRRYRGDIGRYRGDIGLEAVGQQPACQLQEHALGRAQPELLVRVRVRVRARARVLGAQPELLVTG